MRLDLFALVLLLASMAGACSEPARELAPGSETELQRLDLRRSASESSSAAPVVVARLGVEDALDTWRIEEAERVELVVDDASQGAPPQLELEWTRAASIYVPVPDGVVDFNRVDLALTIDTFATLRVDWLVEGSGRSRVAVPLLAKLGPQIVSVELPYRTTVAGAPDELQLVVEGRGTLRLGGIELVKEPWITRLPDPADGARHVRIGGRSRLAVGLSSGAPLTAELGRVTASELVFDRAAPGMLRLPEVAPKLKVSLFEGEAAVGESLHALPTDKKAEPYWRPTSIDLTRFAGRELSARFELVNGGPREAFCALGPPTLVRRAREVPTVLLITSDTHRADHVRASGLGVEVATPALDALAERGVLFENCFTSTNVTNPSHIALMTGTHPRDTRIVDNTTFLVEDAPTLAERFRANGYLTYACVSARHLEHRLSGLGQGFDRLSAPSDPQRDGRATLDELFGWIEEAEGLPVFVWLHLFDVHTPYEVPRALERAYYPAGSDPEAPDVEDPLPVPLRPTWLPKVTDPEYVRALYRAEVSYLDGLLTEVFEHPRFASGHVVFTADHGESLGQHNVYWDHAGLYPQSVHVPMLLAGPDVPSGKRVAAPVEQIDAGRTLLDLAGLAREEFPGENLLLAADAPPDGPAPRFALAAYGHEASLNRGPWLLVLHLEHHTYGREPLTEYKAPHTTELYRLARDPDCLVDLVGTERDQARALRAELVTWLLESRNLGWNRRAVGDAETREKLAALGYTDSAPLAEGEHPWIEPDCACEHCEAFR